MSFFQRNLFGVSICNVIFLINVAVLKKIFHRCSKSLNFRLRVLRNGKIWKFFIAYPKFFSTVLGYFIRNENFRVKKKIGKYETKFSTILRPSRHKFWRFFRKADKYPPLIGKSQKAPNFLFDEKKIYMLLICFF